MSRKPVLLAFISFFILTALVSQIASSQSLANKQYIIPQSGTVNYPDVSVDRTSAETVHNNDTGLNYTTIQEAINAPETSDGHTIFVETGTYYENVVVNKTLSLIGENKETTIIDGNYTGDVVNIRADNVTVYGFTIQNSGKSGALHGIYVDGWVAKSTHNNISCNIIRNNCYGLKLYLSSNNTLSGNVMNNNKYNLDVDGFALSHLLHTIDFSNLVNGKHVYYLINRSDLVINSVTHPEVGYLALINCSNVTVEGLTLANNGQGILLAETNNSRMKENNLISNFNSILLLDSLNNTISGNNIVSSDVGIHLYVSHNNTISGNNIADNNNGVCFSWSSNNTLSGNNIMNSNEHGVKGDSYYRSYHNNFMNNTQHVWIFKPWISSCWNNSYPSGGNYWSDYNGTDFYSGAFQNITGSDGIGDVPYTINEANQDNYPLIGMFSGFKATEEISVMTICNSSISDFHFGLVDKRITFDVDGPNSTLGFCRICVPIVLMNLNFTVYVDGVNVSYSLLACSNVTHNYLYFTYDHSGKEVRIECNETSIEIKCGEPLVNQTPIIPPHQYYRYTLSSQRFIYIETDSSELDVALYANWDGTRPFGNESDDCVRDLFEYPHKEYCVNSSLSAGTYYFRVKWKSDSGTVNVTLICYPSIENVSRTPMTPNYDEDVIVTTIIKYHGSANLTALLSYNSSETWHDIPMNQVDSYTFNATIPPQPYKTMVQYKIYANDTYGNWVVSSTYSYTVSREVVRNLNTSLSYPTIQEAIDANETLDGHTIFVEEGIYYENIVLDKAISLVGQNRSTTIIDGNYTGNVVNIKADNVTVYGFTIQNSEKSYSRMGIYVWYYNSINISYNNIRYSGNGIFLRGSNNSKVTGNYLANNTWSDHSCGLRVERSSNLSAIGNNCTYNRYCGIFLYRTTNSTLRQNNMTKNTYNFGIGGGEELPYYLHNIDTSNTVDGKKVYYYVNQQNSLINPSILPDAGYLALINSTNVTVENMNLTNNRESVLFVYTRNSIIRHVDGSNTSYGIHLYHSSNCSILESYAENTRNSGISVVFSNSCRIDGNIIHDWLGEGTGRGIYVSHSHNVNITRNWIYNRPKWGLYLSRSNDCRVVSNTLESVGTMQLSKSNNTIVFNNNFINVSEVKILDSHSNVWDNGFEGNYWEGYNGTDSNNDGIGDSPYSIDANNTDYYPLMGMFSDFNATSEHHIQTVCNSTISDFNYNGTAIFFNVSGENGTAGFCRICIPKDLINETYRVFINGTEILPAPLPLPCSNSTHNYIYFNYTHSTEEVIIIPEFPSFLVLPLFMLATLLAVIVYKRKHQTRNKEREL